MSCILFLGCGSVTLYAEENDNSDNQNSIEMDNSYDGQDASDVNEPDIGDIGNQRPVDGSDNNSVDENQGTEVITWPDPDENGNEVEEDNDPSLSYSLYYENGSSSENVNSSDNLGTDVGISALKIDANNYDSENLTYAVYLSAKGWQDEVHGGEIAGGSEGLKGKQFMQSWMIHCNKITILNIVHILVTMDGQNGLKTVSIVVQKIMGWQLLLLTFV